MTNLTVFAGPNGSGKSSIRDRMVGATQLVIDADQIARRLRPDDPRSVDTEAGRAAIHLFEQGLASRTSMSIETTLTGFSVVRRMQRAREAGYFVSMIYVALNDAELNVRRVAARVSQGGHWIDPDVIRRRVKTSLNNLPQAIVTADRVIIVDNSGRKHRRLLEVVGHAIVYALKWQPTWLREQMPRIQAALATEKA